MPYARPIRRANMQGTRGAPGRGGVAARPASPRLDGGISPGNQGAAVKGPPPRGISTDLSMPGAAGADFEKIKQATATGGIPPAFAQSIQALKDNPTFQAQVLQGADPQQAMQAAGGDQAVSSGPAKPAWQQLQEMGVGGQGSARANQAKLAELRAASKPGGFPPGAEPGGPAAAPPSGPIAMPTQPNPAGGFFGGGNDMVRQRMKQQMLGRMRGQVGQAIGGAVQSFPMPGQIPNEAPGAPQPLAQPGVGRAALPRRQPMLE